MGAQLWYHEVPWHSDPETALKAFQADYLDEHYDLATLLPQHMEWAKESVEAAQADGDPYNLLEIYQEKLELMQRLCSLPIPDDPAAKVEIVRQIFSDTFEGIGNVLDVNRISEQRDLLAAQRLGESEIARLTGTDKPSLVEARSSIDQINGELGRGECVCFPFYESGEPAGWYFVGNTID